MSQLQFRACQDRLGLVAKVDRFEMVVVVVAVVWEDIVAVVTVMVHHIVEEDVIESQILVVKYNLTC